MSPRVGLLQRVGITTLDVKENSATNDINLLA